MRIGGLLGDQPEISVRLREPVAVPGGEVSGIVVVRSGSEREVQRGGVYLRCEEECEIRVVRGSGKHRRVRRERVSTLLLDLEQPFIERGVLIGGHETEHGFSLPIPEQAPPTYEGDILRLRWYVHAKLDMEMSLDPQAEAGLTVYQPPEGPYPEPRHGADYADHPECGMGLALEGTAAEAGGVFCGAVRLEPRESFAVQEVRLQLRRVEHVPLYKGNTASHPVVEARILGGMELHAGLPVDVPFRLDVPGDLCPSVATSHATVYWELDVVAARSWKEDLHLEYGIHVYTLPASSAEPDGSAP